ncbi:large subunit ribosomal protein L9 [Babesia bovis T2Bo]|uniref:Ribosomal protein L9, N-terminal domain containing protein n=1 Tax=Babesia bovis TaxID=5865 RepID=A7ANQ7_BABBO|nr:large subunit ribosomal protein L9 [Babesia bovis T2Bo]EDO08191.1 large subunit ribosomal protein L9 [Babesia bovis T2Bo]|eukprot:XP_001611759.1 ribosomal protein L9, N-terminal domain containing protein [Babesia bovis T2Bo]
MSTFCISPLQLQSRHTGKSRIHNRFYLLVRVLAVYTYLTLVIIHSYALRLSRNRYYASVTHQTYPKAFVAPSISQTQGRHISPLNAQRWSYTRVTLLKDTPQVGKEGDVVLVNRNYAFNYLVPFGFARYTTRAELIGLTLQKDYKDALVNVRKASAMHLKNRLGDNTVLQFEVPAEAKGSDRVLTPILPIHIIDHMRQKRMLLVVDMLREQDVKIITEEGVINRFGEHRVQLNVDPDVNIEVIANVKEQPVDTNFLQDVVPFGS